MAIPSTGYWTFICNPAKWEIDEFLKTNIEYDTYQVTRPKEFAPGQLGVIRVGTDKRTQALLNGRKKLIPGIYALVEVISYAYKRTDEPGKYWVNWSEKELEKPVVKIKYIGNLLRKPLLLDQLAHFDELQEDKFLLSGFQGASIPLKKIAFEKIIEMVGANEIFINNIEVESVNTEEHIKAIEEKYKNAVPEVKEVISKRIERGSISQKVKQINNYKCLICDALGKNPFTFKKSNGQYYIETHHVMPVSELKQGSLGLSNLITVCPNHHRQIHYGDVNLVEEQYNKFIYTIDGSFVEVAKTSISNLYGVSCNDHV
jgi:hypothetical protein